MGITTEKLEKMNVIRQQIHENAVLSRHYIIMNVLATVIASYGLLADSTAVVIGAMLVAMLLGPIIGIALGLLEKNREKLLYQSLKAELAGVVLVLCVSFIIGLLHQDVPTGKELLSRTQPNIFDLIIALAGGAAGSYAVASPRISAGLVGVAIATALVPPLSTCGILMARGEMDMASGAFLLFFTNLIAIQFASSVVLWVLGYHPIKTSPKQTFIHLVFCNAISGSVLIALAATFSINFTQSISKSLNDKTMLETVKSQLTRFPDAQLVEYSTSKENDKTILQLTVRTSRKLGYWDLVSLQKSVSEQLHYPIVLRMINIPTVYLDDKQTTVQDVSAIQPDAFQPANTLK